MKRLLKIILAILILGATASIVLSHRTTTSQAVPQLITIHLHEKSHRQLPVTHNVSHETFKSVRVAASPTR